MAIAMWDHLIPGLMTYKARWYPSMDSTYFTFHRKLEDSHEEAMERALAAQEMSPQEQKDFRQGALGVLDHLEGFWMGLEGGREKRVLAAA